MSADRHTTDDSGGTLPCPWCGDEQGDTFEIEDDDNDVCGACGGGREITSEAVRTVYASRNAKRPSIDVAAAKRVTPETFAAFMAREGWRSESIDRVPSLVTWRAPAPHDRRITCFVRTRVGDVRMASEAVAELRGCDAAAVLREMAATPSPEGASHAPRV